MNLFCTNPSPIPTAKYGLIQKFKGLKPQICDLSPIPTGKDRDLSPIPTAF